MRRVFLTVIDAAGIGAMPDSRDYGDPDGCNTISNVAAAVGGLCLPSMQSLGLGNIADIVGVPPSPEPAIYGRAAMLSKGKDTTTGHWELAGLVLEEAFPVYPSGFPSDMIQAFVERSGCGGVLCNAPASGTAVLTDYGAEHRRTKHPIIYTSADSVFQVACDVDVIDLETLYKWCQVAADMFVYGDRLVCRVIARPFSYDAASDSYARLSEHRHDYAAAPLGRTVLDDVREAGVSVHSIGKINDIFCGYGIDIVHPGKSNKKCLDTLTELIQHGDSDSRHLVFTNLVETDSHFGHRNDYMGFAEALQHIDGYVGRWLQLLRPEDLLILTADHGCDPTTAGTDHTREHVPILAWSPSLPRHQNIGTRATFADVAASMAMFLSVGRSDGAAGTSFL